MYIPPKNVNNQDIYECIKNDILTLKFPPGKLISENELSKKYNVSRTPIKTAFSRLVSENLIEVLPQRGTYVTLLDIERIKEIIYMRAVLETKIMTSFIDNLQDEVLHTLEENLKQQKKLIDLPEFELSDFYHLDSKYHEILFQWAKRPKLWEIIQEFQVYYTRFRMLDIVTTHSCEVLYQEHVDLYNLIKEQDKENLEKKLFDHLHGNLNRLSLHITNEFKDYFLPYNKEE